MREFYWSASTNFGDAMNGWLWQRVFPELMSVDDGLRLVGVGSLIKRELSYVKGGRKIIFGTGSGYGDFPSREAIQRWLIYFVRGPLTAKFLGLNEQLAIVDASWLISRLPEFQVPTHKSGIVFVPHFSSALASSWSKVCERAGVRFVNPLKDSVEVISTIGSAELAIVESLHGAIIADYFRTPWIPIQLSENTLFFKWIDWCSSVGLEYQPYVMPTSDIYHHLAARQWPRKATGYRQIPEVTYPAPAVAVRDDVKRDSKPSLAYMSGLTARKYARNCANRVMESASGYRNVWPLSIWNEKQEEILAGLLLDLSRKFPVLSRDSIRERRITQLNEKVDELRRDYPSLVEPRAPGS